MKRILTLMLVLIMALSLAACGGESEPAPTDGSAEPQTSQQQEPEDSQPEPSGDESAWLKTKTGQFYSQFSGGKMYMEYEMNAEGTLMTVISATSGDKVYSESKMGGQTAGVTIMDGEQMYIIDHNSKTVMKMSLQASGQEMVETMIAEEDINPADLKAGTREIDGRTYDTEEWNLDGAKSILCFDGKNLAYMIGEFEGQETVIKVIKVNDQVDDSLFEIPADYQVMSL